MENITPSSSKYFAKGNATKLPVQLLNYGSLFSLLKNYLISFAPFRFEKNLVMIQHLNKTVIIHLQIIHDHSTQRSSFMTNNID